MPAPSTDVDRLRSRRRRRRLTVFVTFPAVLIATAGVGSAAGMGWLDYQKPVCKPEVVKAPARGSFTVNVLNATDHGGVAGPVFKELGKRGFRTGTVGNDTQLRAVKGKGEIRYGRKGLDQALLVQQQVPGATLLEMPDRADTTIDVVIGPGWGALAPRPPRPPARPEQVRLNVYNTTYYENLATTTMAEMTARGFKPGDVSADPKGTWVQEIAVIRYGESGDLNAKLVQQHVPGSTLQQDDRTDASVDLLLGMKWKGLKDRAAVPAVPPPPPPVVATVARPCSAD